MDRGIGCGFEFPTHPTPHLSMKKEFPFRGEVSY
uniref:Uncharacterized protein n=1 Tax=Myoviridae sp. ctPJU6 TaxID=2827684 RepID=A0A8S5TJY9_9CAUD|nr:MAG TPA: hypothetical protein [Myoviridae sp. ctPJU6]